MENVIFSRAEDEKDLVEFEKGIYEAFYFRNPTNWVCRNYELIDGCRYRPTVPYEFQRVYLAKEGDKVIAGTSMNMNLHYHPLQLEEIGFSLDEQHRNSEHCEALVFYILRNNNFNGLRLGQALIRHYLEDLHQQGIRQMFTTCSENLKTAYLFLGWNILEEKFNKDGEKKYFLTFTLHQELKPSQEMAFDHQA